MEYNKILDQINALQSEMEKEFESVDLQIAKLQESKNDIRTEFDKLKDTKFKEYQDAKDKEVADFEEKIKKEKEDAEKNNNIVDNGNNNDKGQIKSSSKKK